MINQGERSAVLIKRETFAIVLEVWKFVRKMHFPTSGIDVNNLLWRGSNRCCLSRGAFSSIFGPRGWALVLAAGSRAPMINRGLLLCVCVCVGTPGHPVIVVLLIGQVLAPLFRGPGRLSKTARTG